MMAPNQQQPQTTPQAPANAAAPSRIPPIAPAPSLGYTPFTGAPVNAQASPGLTPGAVSNPVPSATQAATQSAALPAVSPAPTPASTSSAPANLGYGRTSTFGPGNDLLSTQVVPGQESNRFDLAKQALDTYSQSQLPQFRADLRSTIQNNAAQGRLGSGMLNTSLGNLDLAQQRDYNTMEQQLLNGALGNQITDNANQRNELRGERDYQTGQSNNAFNQGVTQTQLGDQLTNSAFGRAATQEQMGEANNPANTQLILSSIFGGQANAANGALGGLIGNTVNRNAQQGGMDTSALLQAIFGGGGSVAGGNTPNTPGAGVNAGGLMLPQPLPGVRTTPSYDPNSDSQTF